MYTPFHIVSTLRANTIIFLPDGPHRLNLLSDNYWINRTSSFQSGMRGKSLLPSHKKNAEQTANPQLFLDPSEN